jgi:tetratricopeptide (TPR) repeat protein
VARAIFFIAMPSLREAQLCHARHYRDVYREARELYLKGDENVLCGLSLFEQEQPHLETAFETLRMRTDPESAQLLISLVSMLTPTNEIRFHPRQRIRYLEAQYRAAQLVGDHPIRGTALGNLGLAYADSGDSRKAIEYCEQHRLIARENGDLLGESNALGNLGIAYKNLGEARKAIEFHEQALVIDRAIGNRRGEGADLGNLGLAYAALGNARKAIELHEKRLAIARELGDRRREGSALGNLGIAYSKVGDNRKAIEFYQQQLAIVSAIADKLGEGNAYGNLGDAYRELGDHGKALEFYGRQFAAAQKNGNQRAEGKALYGSALVLDKMACCAQAMVRAEAALKLFESIEDPSAAEVRASLSQWRGNNGGRCPV